jgi:DHA2 family multidrug resistance protein-like MFS transporter
MFLLPAAALGESLGPKRVFVAGAAVFTAGSVACALSPSLTWLVAARFAQGVGGAGILSLGIALLRFVVPSHRVGTAIGWNALTVALSSAAGPTLGAMILSFGPWPWLYAVNLPIGACVLMAARALPSKKGSGRPLDLMSAAISMGMFASFVLGAENVHSNPMAALGLFIGAALMTAILMRRESRRTAPLIPLDLLRQSSFRVSLVASVLCFVGQTAALVSLPYHLHEGFGLSPFMTALYMLPWPLAVAATGPLSGRIADRVQTAMLCAVGGVLLAIGLGSAALVPIQGPQLAVGVSMMLCGVGFSLFNVSNNRNLLLSAPRERSGTAGGLQSVARLTGQTLGAVLMTFLLAAYPLSSAPRVGFAIAALLTLAAGVTSTMRVGGKANQPCTNGWQRRSALQRTGTRRKARRRPD